MGFDISERSREGVVILKLKGRLTVGESTPVRERITQTLAAGRNKIVLDLKDAEYIDSTGLGALVICFTQAKKAGGSLKLLNLNKRNVELLALTRLHTVFETFAEETDAVNSFFPGREIKHFDILAFVQRQAKERGEDY
ncbi:MAG: STAS domain-containing protein [Bryobacteraceae bacterium]